MLEDHLAADRIRAAIGKALNLHSSYQSYPPRRDIIRKLLPRIELASAKLVLRLDARELSVQLIGSALEGDASDQLRLIPIERPISLRRRGIDTRIVLADRHARRSAPDETLIRMLQKAHSYLAQLTDGSGRSIGEVAAANWIDRSDFSRVLRLAFLAPRIAEQIVSGTQPPELIGQKLTRIAELPHAWTDHAELLGP